MKANSSNSLGFSLLELTVAVAIIAVLTAIAVPRFQQLLINSRQIEAQQVLISNAKRLERCFTLTGVYNGTCTLKTLSEGGYYSAVAVRTETTFLLTATPTDKGGQSSDAHCTQFTLTETGATGASGTSANTCW